MGSDFRSTSHGSNRQGQPPFSSFARNYSGVMTNDLSSRGPPSTLESSGGIQGPPTLSCSGDGNPSNDTSSTEASVPLTNEEGMEVMPSPATMGHVGPGSRAQSPYSRRSSLHSMRSSDSENDPHRPMITIQDAHPDAMSVLSDPTMVDFGHSGEDWTNAATPSSNRQSYSSHRGSARPSYASPVEKNSSKGTPSANNKALRQGAVDKMVMEALRQAQEAREGSVGGLKSPGVAAANSGAAPYRHIGQPVNPPLQATSQLLEEMKDLTMKRSSSRSETTASKHSKRSKHSPHGGRKDPSYHRAKGQKQQQPSPSFRSRSDPQEHLQSPPSSSRESSSGSRNHRPMVPGSIHSFYSGSGATSYETGDAFDC